MKYLKWYNNIVSNAQCRVKQTSYTETHHIIPKSLGGTNNPDNLVKLFPREHFMCHLLLAKIHSTGEENFKMLCALSRFTYKDKLSSKVYVARMEELRKSRRERMIGERNPNWGAKCHTAEVRLKMSGKREFPGQMGKWKRTPETNKNMSNARKGLGVGERNAMASKENREKVRLSKIGRKKYVKDGVYRYILPELATPDWIPITEFVG